MNTRLRREIQSRHEAAWVARQTLNLSWKHFSTSPSNHFHFWSFVVKKENRISLVIFGAVNGEYGTPYFERNCLTQATCFVKQYSLLTEIPSQKSSLFACSDVIQTAEEDLSERRDGANEAAQSCSHGFPLGRQKFFGNPVCAGGRVFEDLERKLIFVPRVNLWTPTIPPLRRHSTRTSK